MSMEEENELRQFLKLARPDWSMPRRKGHNDIVRACDKLKAIGVQDVADLLHRVTANTINDDLSEAHKPRFSRETIMSIRKEGTFWQSLSHLSEPSYRQIGLFAPVPQMLADRNLRIQALKSSGTNSGALPLTGAVSTSSGSRHPSASSVRPNTVDHAGSTKWSAGRRAASFLSSTVGSSTMSSESPRIRPSSMALSIPYSSNLDGEDDSFEDCGVLPRLRGARARAGARDTSHMNWRRTQMSTSVSLPCFLDAGGSICESISEVGSLPDVSRGLSAGRRLSMPADTSAAASTVPASSASNASWGAHGCGASNASQAGENDDIHERQVERWVRAGTTMISTPLTPGWSSFQKDTLLQHGEAMIREQEDLQHKKKLYQQMALEGRTSPMRQHLAEKIETRLREEKSRDAQAAMEVHQSCMSIRSNINGMSSLRKDLSSLRMETEHTLEPQRHRACTAALSLDFFKKSKQHGLDDNGEDAATETG